MYHVIGLKKDGKLALWTLQEERPSIDELEAAVKVQGYTQLLVTESSMGQIARFKVAPSLVTQVELA